jgi:hypothetical protein
VPAYNDDTLPEISAKDRARLTSSSPQSASAFECFNCGWDCKVGELACPKCQTMFASGGRTRKLKDEVIVYQQDKKRITGDVFVTSAQTIQLHIEGACVELPVQTNLIVGRASGASDDTQPDVDLGPFKAGDYGVSRQHIKITRVRESIQIADLGSSNGTFLNGRRIAPNITRLLRNGDELQLGYLKVRVTFR